LFLMVKFIILKPFGKILKRFPNVPARVVTNRDDTEFLKKAKKSYSNLHVILCGTLTSEEIVEKIAETHKKNDSVIVSVAAGIALDTLKSIFGDTSKLCRVMPNQPCLIGRGVSALIASNLNEDEKALASYLFDSVGKSIWIENEDWMHTVTAVSGNGPAYFYHMMELLTESAKIAGIPEKIAQELVIHTAIGSSQLALNSSDDFATLRKKVMSPGGTTEAAFESLENNNIQSIWKQAIDAATQRSIELGNQDSDNESE